MLLFAFFIHLFHIFYLSHFSKRMKVFAENNIGDKHHKENIEAAADRQSPSAARRLARLVGFVLGAEGRRSMKTEDVATQQAPPLLSAGRSCQTGCRQLGRPGRPG